MKYLFLLWTALIVYAGAGEAQVTDPDGDMQINREARAQVTRADLGLWGNPTLETHTNIDPGEPPEGDFLGGMAFTRDGNRVFLCNRMTNNVTVFDWATMETLANIPVGTYPHGIAISSDYAVVACAFSDYVFLIDLSTLTVTDSIATGEQPWVVRISPDQHYAYVSCDIANTCEVIDLQTQTHVMTISDFPIFLSTWSWNSANGRNDVTFSEFELTRDGEHIVVSGLDSTVKFINTTTGLVDFAVPGILAGATIGLSGDTTKAAALVYTNPLKVYQLDLLTHTVIDSVVLTGYTLGYPCIAMNGDGSKAYTGVSNNRSALIRFDTHDFITFTQTYTAFWIGTSPDHRYAISGQYNFSVVDFVTEAVVGQAIGYSQSRGTVAPFDMRAVGEDPHRHEGIYFFDLATPNSPTYRGTTMSGELMEGDAPRRAAITPDQTKIVVTNELSDNVSIINVSTLETEAIILCGDGPWEVEVTPNAQWAVVAGFNSNQAHIVDLSTNTVAANIPTSSRPGTVAVSPNGDYAYVGTIAGNTIAVIQLDGENSVQVADIPCGEIGVVWASYGVLSDVEVSPTGQWVLVAASFDDQVKVIDTQTNTVVASLTVGDFPLQIAFGATDDYATVTNYFSNSYSVMHIDGAASSVVGTFGCGSGPLRLAYNPVEDEMGIGVYTDKIVRHINPYTGELIESVSYVAYGNITGIGYGSAGEEIVMTIGNGQTPSQLHRGADHIALPSSPTYFGFDASGTLAAATIPGPDWVTVVDWREPPLPAEDVTVYYTALNANAQVRFLAPEAGTYVIYATADRNATFPEAFGEVGRITIPAGYHAWDDEEGIAPYKRYVIVQER